ncbi:MAG: DinB family protein [Actinomycetota bacterium]|nr:DinB family protein [Actinomycetota bacterium]
MNSETELLQQYLDLERNHVLGILEGFSEEQLRRPVLPSGWNCLGMVKHLALADEHYWFRGIVAGEPLGFGPPGPDAEWQVGPGESAEDIFTLYRDEIERANAIISATPLDAAPRQRDPKWGEWGARFTDLRVVMLHVLKETACHAGHLDAVAELIDGRQWIVLG